MKYLIPFTAVLYILMSVSVAGPGNASTIILEGNDGSKLYLTDDGKLQTELFTREQDEQAYCLAENIYFEARSDSLAGQAAVADVVINRVHDDRYPNTICEVVREGPVKESWKTQQTEDPNDAVYYPVRDRCQFSWWCDGKEEVINDKSAWAQAQYVAYQMIYAERYRGITEGATHYHAHYVNPKWAKSIQFVSIIDSHKFYRWN